MCNLTGLGNLTISEIIEVSAGVLISLAGMCGAERLAVAVAAMLSDDGGFILDAVVGLREIEAGLRVPTDPQDPGSAATRGTSSDDLRILSVADEGLCPVCL